jgi:hypothetical protein
LEEAMTEAEAKEPVAWVPKDCGFCFGLGFGPSGAQCPDCKVAEFALPGEHPSSLYSPLAIAHAGAEGLLRVTPTGLGFTRDLKPDLEPAPQPPATTEGEKLLGPTEALRAEIVAALETVNAGGHWLAGFTPLEKLAELLREGLVKP